MSYKNKTLLFIDGSAVAIPAVKRAKELGIKTVVANYYDENQSPAKKYADISLKINFTDIKEIVKKCKELKIDGMFQGWTDSHLPIYAEICRIMSWYCYGTIEQFNICANKDIFRNTCRKYNVPIAEEYQVTINNDSINIPNDISYPVIVKPTDSSGSRGVCICKNKEELISNYKIASEISPSNHAIVEQFLTGQHVNIYYTMSDGEVYLSAMADRYVDYHDKKSAPMPVCLIHPSRYLSDFEKETNHSIKRMFKGLGMKNGIAFVQGFRCNNGCFKIYEMGYRPNGGATYSLIEECSNYNQLDMLINFALTGKMGYDTELKVASPDFNKKIAVNYVISVPNENISVSGIEGIDKINKIDGVIDVVQKRFSVEKNAKTNRPIDIAFVLIVVNTEKELEKCLLNIKDAIRITSTSGEKLKIAEYDPKTHKVHGASK